MNILNFFKEDNSTYDPYWVFDKDKHFRPKLNKGDFFKLQNFDFGWFVLEPIVKFIKDREHEIERGSSLSYGQKALYYWWYVDAQVKNGGFVQFYYNGYAVYVPTIIKSLEYIGDKKMADLIQRAHIIYQKNINLIDEAREKDLFGSELYDKLEEMSALDAKYYKLNEKTMAKIERYVRRYPNEICLDEEGKEYNMKFSGQCKTYYSENKIKEIFSLQDGIINGEFKSFYENGNIKEQIQYLNGEQTGERAEYYENGNKRYTVNRNNTKNQFEHYCYHENDNPKKLEHKLLDKDERIGEYKEWFDNGQLAKAGTYLSNYEREGQWLEFYRDGSKKLEAQFKNGEFLIHNCWNDKGEQTLKDGTGLYVYDYSGWKGHTDHNEQEYKNFKRHGKQYSYTNGILTLYQEMENGKEHGITRRYYKNGKIKEETLYQNGKQISRKEFSMFKKPKVVTNIICEMEDIWLINRELETADNYPLPLNAIDLARNFEVDVSLFDGYPQDHELSYSYFVAVDNQGNVSKIDFLVADNGRITAEVEQNIQKLKFEPAKKHGQHVNSYVIVKHQFRLDEA